MKFTILIKGLPALYCHAFRFNCRYAIVENRIVENWLLLRQFWPCPSDQKGEGVGES
jgi:hypothetical protein